MVESNNCFTDGIPVVMVARRQDGVWCARWCSPISGSACLAAPGGGRGLK